MKSTIQSLKGTRDFYPEEMGVRNFIYQTARKVSQSFGYQEFDAPFLETLELYAAKSGEELVKEQAFVFPDRGGDFITLRPELTPSLARMVAQRQKQLVFPLRWWSWGPFWRYERPQKGRTREFFQWNIDLVGVNTPQADAELVAIAASFLQESGLSPQQASILVNNRQLIDEEMNDLHIAPTLRPEVLRLIDRRDKMPFIQWEAYAQDIGLNQVQFSGVQAFLADDNLWKKSKDLIILFNALDVMELSKYVRYAPHVIRGLDYYTGTVFEMWDQDGEFRAILGGGRYNNLVADVGGEPIPAVGFAMGDAVISLVLKKFGCLPSDLGNSPAAVLVTVFDESMFAASFRLASQLRLAGINVACFPEAAKLSRQFKYGDRMGMRLALVIGPDEEIQRKVTLKDLRTSEQSTVPMEEIVGCIQRALTGT